MLEPDESIPDDRCGFVLQPEQVSEGLRESDPEKWATRVSLTTCIREVWIDERCIWHADERDKPVEELKTRRTNNPECLDGAILVRTKWPRGASFDGCSLIGLEWRGGGAPSVSFEGANLTDANFSEGAFLLASKFKDSRLRNVEFQDVNLQQARFSDSRLQHSKFNNVFLLDARFSDSNLLGCDFSGSDLTVSKFSGVNLLGSEFVDSHLERAEFPDVNLRQADLTGAVLHDTVLTHADCRGATFTGAFLYETVFADTRINSSTTFYDPEKTYYESITSRPACVYEENPLTDEDLDDDTHPLEAARWVYRRLETLHEENAMSEEARKFHISKEDAERKLHAERGEWKGRLIKEAMRWLTRHGESAQRTITSWLVVILAFGLAYPFVGGIKDNEGIRYEISPLSELATFDGLNDLLLNVYFSGITFSTIGYGDLSPAAPGTRALVFVESLVGAVLVALLVFVLGRRVAR